MPGGGDDSRRTSCLTRCSLQAVSGARANAVSHAASTCRNAQ